MVHKMNTYNINNDSELLHLYLDGELDATNSALVEDKLSVDSALQQEKDDMLSIRDSVRNDKESFTPPSESESIIFNRLGIKHPSDEFVPLAAPLLRTTSSLWKRWAIPAGTALVAGFLAWFFMGNENESNSIANSQTKQQTPVVSSIENNNSIESNNINAIQVSEITTSKVKSKINSNSTLVINDEIIDNTSSDAAQDVNLIEEEFIMITEQDTPYQIHNSSNFTFDKYGAMFKNRNDNSNYKNDFNKYVHQRVFLTLGGANNSAILNFSYGIIGDNLSLYIGSGYQQTLKLDESLLNNTGEVVVGFGAVYTPFDYFDFAGMDVRPYVTEGVQFGMSSLAYNRLSLGMNVRVFNNNELSIGYERFDAVSSNKDFMINQNGLVVSFKVKID